MCCCWTALVVSVVVLCRVVTAVGCTLEACSSTVPGCWGVFLVAAAPDTANSVCMCEGVLCGAPLVFIGDALH